MVCTSCHVTGSQHPQYQAYPAPEIQLRALLKLLCTFFPRNQVTIYGRVRYYNRVNAALWSVMKAKTSCMRYPESFSLLCLWKLSSAGLVLLYFMPASIASPYPLVFSSVSLAIGMLMIEVSCWTLLSILSFKAE